MILKYTYLYGNTYGHICHCISSVKQHSVCTCAANSFVDVQAFRLTAIVVDFQIGCCISTCDRDVLRIGKIVL